MKNVIEYIVYLTAAFARYYSLSEKSAYHYLQKFGGIRLAEEYYDIMHTQSFNDMVQSVASYCRRKGGYL